MSLRTAVHPHTLVIVPSRFDCTYRRLVARFANLQQYGRLMTLMRTGTGCGAACCRPCHTPNGAPGSLQLKHCALYCLRFADTF